MVENIKYKGKEYPVRLSYRVFKGLKEEKGSFDLKQIQSMDFSILEDMLWLGLKSGNKTLEEPQDLDLKKEDMEDVLDEIFFDFIKMIPKFFPKAKLGNLGPNLEEKLKELQTQDQGS